MIESEEAVQENEKQEARSASQVRVFLFHPPFILSIPASWRFEVRVFLFLNFILIGILDRHLLVYFVIIIIFKTKLLTIGG